MIRAAKPKPSVPSTSETRESGILPTSSSRVPPPLRKSSVPPPLSDENDVDVIELTEDDLIEIVPPPLPLAARKN